MTPTDHGRPVPRGKWDRQYRARAFGYLDSIDELAHYVIVAGYVRTLFTRPAILDVGCGHGRMVDLLSGVPFKRYHGIDVSSEAIRRGRRRAARMTTFEVADFDAWNPPQRFDVIVFCESLNYARHPASTLLRYARALEGSGAIIVSLFRYRKPGGIVRQTWKNIQAYFAIVDSTAVTNHKGQTWDIKVLRQKTERAK